MKYLWIIAVKLDCWLHVHLDYAGGRFCIWAWKGFNDMFFDRDRKSFNEHAWRSTMDKYHIDEVKEEK